MSGLRRITHVRPGYDCRNVPCKHERKGDHGIAGDEWTYVVTDGQTAINLSVLTSRYPDTVPPVAREVAREAINRDGYGNLPSDLGRHFTKRVSEWECPLESCLWLDGQPCFYDGSGLQALEFWLAHGDGSKPEQGEAFWVALEAEWREQAERRVRE